LEEFLVHKENHLLNEEPCAYKVNTIEIQVGTQVIYYEEQGYWETIYVYE